MGYYVKNYCYTCGTTRNFYINSQYGETVQVCSVCQRTFRSNSSPKDYIYFEPKSKSKFPEDAYFDFSKLPKKNQDK